jgi:hypothetical protein
MNLLRQRELSAAATDLIQFDADSLRRLGNPDIWLADPDAYEMNGRLLRDSDTPRMLAYSKKGHILYVTDGCNSCVHNVDLDTLTNVAGFAEENALRLDLLERLKGELATKGTK